MKYKPQIRSKVRNRVLSLTAQRDLCADRIQNDVNRLLENDSLFARNYRALRNNLTAGVINSHTFKAIRSWQIGDAIRRAGLPLVVTRTYLRLIA